MNLKNVTVVFTGAGRVNGQHITRNVLATAAQAVGIRVQSMVNPSTTFLVTDTPDSGSRKNQKANALGVERMTVEKFVKTYGMRMDLKQSDLFTGKLPSESVESADDLI